MNITIKRFDKNNIPQTSNMQFSVENKNLLHALNEIKSKQDATLSYRCGCRSGVCGSCAIRVNGVEKLACKTIINENDLIEPLKNYTVIRDLVVDVSHETLLLKRTNSFLEENSTEKITIKDIEKIDKQSNCILCDSCYSACPVYDVNKDFLGPFALTRALRYVNDKKVAHSSNIIDEIQKNGIWDCTLCSACTLVCPQNIDPKADIMALQNISVQKGYTNPYMQDFNSTMNFDDDFGGFNPNGF